MDAPSAAGERILLVEDEDHVRHAAQQILEALGYEVVTARNGREALTLCASPRWAGAGLGVDVVVTDVMMPQMDGRELLARLRRRDHTLRAVAITGYPLLDADVEALKASGFVEVVRKPFKAEDLAGPIRQALAGGEQR